MAIDQLEAILQWIVTSESTSSPLTFALLAALAMLLFWLAVAPSRSRSQEENRLAGYLQGRDIIEDADLERSFWQRAIRPALRRIFGVLTALTPVRSVRRIQRLLVEAGEPGGLTAPDVFGLQILASILLGALYLLLLQAMGTLGSTAWLIVARNGSLLILIGFLLPRVWLQRQATGRKNEIARNFSNALDLLSVAVDAGLGLDSAMVKVSERWDNALTREINRTVLEIRVGTPRNLALQRMADRTGVRDVETFVGVLIQSSELGVSIAETLHNQAAQVRVRRRQRAEELARQAAVKMVIPLVFLVFPALLVVLLGPGIPRIINALSGL
ncbi:MAG: type II secretion system F family protein [Anaerolineae bacterium]|nr:type II secretion system F family protein [Anaerolineae bacterium]